MTTPDSQDDALFESLAAAWRGVGGPLSDADAIAARPARERVGAINAWDLAELASDSLHEQQVAVRSADLLSGRRLVFYAADVTLHVDVTTDLLLCRLEAAATAQLTLVTPAKDRHSLVDVGGGRYELVDPPTGTVRLEVRSPATQVVSAWFRL